MLTLEVVHDPTQRLEDGNLSNSLQRIKKGIEDQYCLFRLLFLDLGLLYILEILKEVHTAKPLIPSI